MNQIDNSNSDGCAGKVIHTFFVIFFGAALIGSFLLMPIANRVALEMVCQPRTIVYDVWTNGRYTPSCKDKKTGKKIDVGIYEAFGCCPLAFVFFFLLVYMIVVFLVTPNPRKSNRNLPPNNRNYRA